MAQLPRIDDMRPINELHRLEHAIDKGWLWKHESGTYVKFTQAGAELFA